MTKVSDIFAKLNEHAPVELKMGFDNVGQLAGRSDRTVDRVLVSLDITDAVIEEARTMGAQLIVSHHPLHHRGRYLRYLYAHKSRRGRRRSK